MTKLEQLKAAYEAATPGEWETNQDADITSGVKFVATALFPDSEVVTQIEYNNAAYIVLAHNLMPQLLEAVAKLEWIAEFCAEHPEWFGGDDPSDGAENEWLHDTQQFLEKLK